MAAIGSLRGTLGSRPDKAREHPVSIEAGKEDMFVTPNGTFHGIAGVLDSRGVDTSLSKMGWQQVHAARAYPGDFTDGRAAD